jgi:hypothetical protein
MAKQLYIPILIHAQIIINHMKYFINYLCSIVLCMHIEESGRTKPMRVFTNGSLFPSFAATFIIPKTYYFVENRTETKFSSQTISKVTICGKIILYRTFHSNEDDSANFTVHSINIHNSG